MSRLFRTTRGTGIASLGFAVAVGLAMLPLPGEEPASAQPPVPAGLPAGLQFVPPDAAFFVYVDVAKVWNCNILQSIRKADAKTFDLLTTTAKTEFGIAPEDVKSVVAFVPRLKRGRDMESLGIAIAFNKAFDADKLQKGAAQLLGIDEKLVVRAVDDRTAFLLLNLKAWQAEPQSVGETGPLTVALKEAASGKFAIVAGAYPAALPDEFRQDEDRPPPPELQPFLALGDAYSLTATLEADKSLKLDVRVKARTAGQGAACEQALHAGRILLRDELTREAKETEPEAAKDAALKDLIALMKAVSASAHDAKVTRLDREIHLTATLPGDLPFAAAFIAARKKIEESAIASQSKNNLKQIALAMHNYESATGNFPPAAVCDKADKRLLSWRVMILPYIEENELFKQFKLDEPWDSENNKKLLAKMPKVYAIPGKNKPGDTDTYYRVFVGEGAAFDWVKGGSLVDIRDGTSNTIMCVTAAQAVPWTKPDELEFDPKKDMKKLVGAVLNDKMQAAFCDGHVAAFSMKTLNEALLKAVITRDGGEIIDRDLDKP